MMNKLVSGPLVTLLFLSAAAQAKVLPPGNGGQVVEPGWPEWKPSPQCMHNYFTCPDSQCVPVLQVCDGTPDCSDGADELKCDNLPESLLMEQFIAVTLKYPGCDCNTAIIQCRRHLPDAVFRGDTNVDVNETCQASSRMATCMASETYCIYSEADETFVRGLTLKFLKSRFGCDISSAIETVPIPPTGSCVSSCTGLPSGDYQSCHGCDVYATCYRGFMLDRLRCPSGLVWDDTHKKCEKSSTTCSA